jgi:hypothetical protein
MNGSVTKERRLWFEVKAEAVGEKPIVAFAVAKQGGPGPRMFTFAGDAGQIERLAAELMRAAADARLMALMESRRKPRPANRRAVR